MEWIVENWGFVIGVGIITLSIGGIAWQTKRNSSDIKQLDRDIRENRRESNDTIKELFSKLEDNRKELSSTIKEGFGSINDKLFGMAKEGFFKDRK